MLTIILSIFLGCSLYFNIEGLFLLRKQDKIIRELLQEKDESKHKEIYKKIYDLEIKLNNIEKDLTEETLKRIERRFKEEK